ncbi:MAG: phosphate acyltransferase PlsX [Clostridia bacterium]|nr:phosphate acyltransferase PlsX [Clostridia bacterium]
MKIVVDGFGGDNAPSEIVKACVMAVREFPDLEIIITGKTDEIQKCLTENDYLGSKIKIVEAPDVISCEDENPAMQIRQKPNSSLVVAVNILKEDDDVKALVSAGSTGAVLSAGFLKVGRIRGVSRPALAPTLPSKDVSKGVVLLDCGANADCKPINLCHFALMGSIYYSKMFGVENPKVALLSNGTEDAKGKELTKEAFQMLKKLPINFVGNMEARELISGKYDVVVADGFAGNVALKATEGAALFVLDTLKENIMSSFKAKLGAIFMKNTFKSLKSRLDYKQYGGSLFLGCKKNILKAHGDSKAPAFLACIRQAINVAKHDVNAEIEKTLATLEIEE